ncbi:hypothetical protein OKJ48_36100 [Streptomyces kunmingensis]|uniref:DNA methylase adenine-specific domain-containing protein n=1 Tax=Streptomyces kunmingensis TaxID=68225 RepID=A0ABU6CMD5_9ACTN|nr:hypothetical protein [Streptomyces kunmingensis]MEB3965614.1 hypothetical protein [Streptomyces kunmingensis]
MPNTEGFYTPRAAILASLLAMDELPDDWQTGRLTDPALGTGGMLKAATEYVRSARSDAAAPYDWEATLGGLTVQVECKSYGHVREARSRLRQAADALHTAQGTAERRTAAGEFLAALAELVAQVFAFLVRVLMRLLSRLLGYPSADDVPVWAPVPLERTPEISPRGPNSAFPVNTHRGGHYDSRALGSAILAA